MAEQYPTDEAVNFTDPQEQRRLLTQCTDWLIAAENARRAHEDRWSRYYKLYRSFVIRNANDWSSKVFIPIVFYVVETILPKLVAALPKMVVYPNTEDDDTPIKPDGETPAEIMEAVLEWSAGRTDLYLELVKAFKSALKYGTGILKVYHWQDIRKRKTQIPIMEPVSIPMSQPLMDPETGEPMMDVNGQPMTDQQDMQVGSFPTGEYEDQIDEVTIYDGPRAEAIDIFNMWVAPEATGFEDARYIIQRYWRDVDYVRERVESGDWEMPEGMNLDSFVSMDDEEHAKRLRDIGLDVPRDPSRRPVEVHEIWCKHGTDVHMYTMLNKRAIVQSEMNIYEHGKYPYVRVCDHFNEFEFWGTGEIEPLEGLQDEINALTNQRIDNVKLALNLMFYAKPDALESLTDLKTRPGGIIRVRPDYPLADSVQPVQVGDVTASAFEEVAEAERMTEKISAVTGYTSGNDTQSDNPAATTATGVLALTEQGNTRFSLKITLAELTGLKQLAEMYGSGLQQFMPDGMWLRLQGPEGQYVFQQLSNDDLQGTFDYDIEAQSATVTESQKRNDAITLLQQLSALMGPPDPMTGMPAPLVNVNQLVEDVLRTFGVKNVAKYMAAPPMQMPQAQIDPNTGLPIGQNEMGVSPGASPEQAQQQPALPPQSQEAMA